MLSLKQLRKIESKLNELYFCGVGLGDLMGTNLLLGIYIDNYRKESLSKTIARKWYVSNFGLKKLGKETIKKNDLDLIKGRWLFTFFSSRENNMLMNGSLLSILSPQKVLALLLAPGARKWLQNHRQNPICIELNNLPANFLEQWKNEWKILRRPLLKLLKIITQSYNLPKKYQHYLLSDIIEQTQLYCSYYLLLEEIKPRIIITEQDRYGSIAPLVLAARKYEIPTITLMHGMIDNPVGFTPVLADYIFCWGAIQKRQLLEWEVPEEKICITGAPQLSRISSCDEIEARNKLNLSLDKKVVLFASTTVTESLRLKLAEEFCKAITQLDARHVGVYKLHPVEKISFYAKIMQSYPKIRFITNELTLDESLVIGQVVCLFSTAFGFDAIIKQKPVIILNLDNSQLGSSKLLIEKAKVPVAESAEELIQIISALDTIYNWKASEKFLHNYCIYFEEEAAMKAIETARRLLKKQVKSFKA